MDTECYAMVRGSAIRVTGLGRRGSLPDPLQFAVSKSVAKVVINEVTESGSDEMLGSDENDNDNRLRIVRSAQTLNYTVDIDFLRVDPGVLSLVAGVPLVYQNLGGGFGKLGFGEETFGGEASAFGFGGDDFGESDFGTDGSGEEPVADPLVIGFDSDTRRAPVSFSLEVWSKLAGQACAGEVIIATGGFDSGGFDMGGFDEPGTAGSSGQRQYGYTVFPYLRGGRLTGFEFKNGLVSFNIRGAQTRRAPRWGVGPYDLEGSYERLVEPVSGNTLFQQALTTATPPTEVDGIQVFEDVIDGGTASLTSDDILSGGTAASTSPWRVEGGRAL